MSNNALFNHDCPRIGDYRPFTDYRPSCYVHDLIIKQNNIQNSYDLKRMLQCNAMAFQKINKDYYSDKMSCDSCGSFYQADPNDQNRYWDMYNRRIGYKTCGKK